VAEGYAHYCTLLPSAFSAEDVGLRQVSAMLGFLFSLESVALSLGCDRAQLELAVAQSHPDEPSKVALHWAAQAQLGRLTLGELRTRCDDLLANPLVVPAFPRYLSGLIQALDPAPALAGFVVELLSKAFSGLRDPVLLPWLPTLIQTLRSEAAEVMPILVREAGRILPATLAEVDAWRPPWSGHAALSPPGHGAPVAVPGPLSALLRAHPATVDGIAALLPGEDGGWAAASGSAGASGDADSAGLRALLAAHPGSTNAVATALAS
jgi:hypothetical protein